MKVESTVGIVLAHSSAAETVKRHIPYWLKICSHLVLVIPEDHTINIKHPAVTVYRLMLNATAYSPATSARFHQAIDVALKNHSAEHYVIFEYDSLCWGPIPDSIVPHGKQVTACQWPNEAISPIRGLQFQARYYLHFPQIFPREALQSVSDAIRDKVPYEAEHGYTDRFVGAACIAAGLKVIDTRSIGLAYSWQDISKYPARVNACIEAVKKGVIFSHGIKDAPSLKRIAEVSPFGVLPS